MDSICQAVRDWLTSRPSNYIILEGFVMVIEVEFVCYSCRHGGLSVGDKILAVNDRVSPTFSNIWLLVSGCFLL